MRSAPSVVYPVGRCIFHGRLLFVLSALGLAALIGWTWSASDRFFGETVGLGLGLWVLWSVGAFKVWWRTPMGALHWDSLASSPSESLRAGAWRWHAEGANNGVPLQSIECVIDCQSWILLRLKHPVRAATWVWVERHRAPAHWGDLRRALVAISER